jgi:tetratricopeptide (TPR) repeat protein/CHAT domain-containing protein
VKSFAKIVIIHLTVFFCFWGCGKNSEQKATEAAQLLTRAQDLISDQRYMEALNLLRSAVQLNTGLENDTALANTYLFIGACQQQIGDYDSARMNYQYAGQYFHTIGDKHLERKARIVLADFYSLMGKNQEAFLLASDAATEAKLFSDVNDRYAALATVARTNHNLERFDEEQQALDEMRLIDSLSRRGQARDSLFLLQFRSASAQGKQEYIGQVFRRWCASAAGLEDNDGLGSAWYEYGRWQQQSGRPDSAVRSYSRALEYLGVSRSHALRIDIWSALGNIAYSQRKFENARTYFANGLDLAQKYHHVASNLMLQLSLLASDWKRQTHESGVNDLHKAELIADSCHQVGYHRAEALSWYLAGMLAEEGNNNSKVNAYFRKAWHIVAESFDDGDEDNDFCKIFLTVEGRDWTDPLLRIYCSANRVDSVFILAEEQNRHDLLNFISRLSIKTSNVTLNNRIEDIQWKYQSLRLNEHDAREAMDNEKQSPIRLLYLAKQMSGYIDGIHTIADTMIGVNKNFSMLFSLKPVSIEDIRAAIPAGTALVEFIPLENTLQILVVKKDTAVLYRTAVNRSYLLSLVRDYLQLMGELRLTTYGLRMTEPAALQRINELSSVLYSLLLSPISGEMKSIQKLYVVSPEKFSWLPVHTLRGEGGAVGQRLNISYLPSAEALLFTHPQEMWVKKVIGLGHPGTTNWDVEYELKDIRSFFDKAPMFFDTAATLSHLRETSYDLLHMALEFSLDRSVPDNSRVMLADGRTSYGTRSVSLGELIDIPVPEILVFSNISNVPGGLQRYAPLLFLANGSSTVIASMWQGDRRAKKAFGEGFYTNLYMGSIASDAYFKSIVAMTKREDLVHVQRWGLYYQFGK